MPANKDYKDLFKILNEEKVEYLIVGAHAVIYYAEPRYTKDLDIWVNPSQENSKRVWKALSKFGAPLTEITLKDFQDSELIYQIGIEPNRIDILMGVAGLDFEVAYSNKSLSTYDGEPINILNKKDLIKTKKTTGRAQDIIDIENLEK